MVSDIASKTAGGRHIAYVSLQAVVEGQDTWAAVNEIVRGIEASGWSVDVYFPDYGGRSNPDVVSRLTQMNAIRRRIAPHIAQYDALYVRAHPLAYQISALARRRGIPVVQECNGPYEDLFIAHPAARIARAFFERLQRSQYRNASAIISVAKGLTEWLVADTGNHNVTTNPNGANIDVFTPDAPKRAGLPERYAVFFGQFATWQGIGTLLDAVRHPSWPADLPLVFVHDRRSPEKINFQPRFSYHVSPQTGAVGLP